MEESQREVAILNKLSSTKNVVKLVDVYEDPRHLYLVTEMCGGGELYDVICAKSESDEVRTHDIQTSCRRS